MTSTSKLLFIGLTFLLSMSCETFNAHKNHLDKQDFTQKFIVILNDGMRFMQYTETKLEEDYFKTNFPIPPYLKIFREEIKNIIATTDSKSILSKQITLTEGKEDKKNISLLLEGKAGKLRKINKLEALLLEIQLKRQDMLKNPSEFFAMVFKRKSLYRIYYYTVDKPGIGNVSYLNQAVEEALSEGFSYEFNLHNHNFFLDKQNIQGGVVPSAPDIGASRNQRDNYGTKAFLITNGFETVEITAKDLDIFVTFDDKS